jgi:alkylation response protein AidB-like acyl-CoA dehydrogenase
MNFEFSEEQNMLRDQARSFLADKCSLKTVREILDGESPFAADVWQGMVELGWTGTAIPEEYGGIGMGYLELCVIAEESGRALAPTPFSSSVYLFAEALLAAGTEEQKKKYLPLIATGEAIGTVAVFEGPQAPSAKNIKTQASAGKLTGIKSPVPDGDVANLAIVAANSDKGLSLYIADMSDDTVVAENVATLDPTRSHANVTFSGTSGELLGDEGDGWTILGEVFNSAAVLFAFEQVGGAQAALDMGKEYAMTRFAFGRPIATFQAIKHKLADMYVATELARSNCYYGAWALDTHSDELPIAAATCRVSATEAYHECSKENIQIHGGMGFTWEFDCHMYYRRSKLLAVNLGGQPRWKDMLITRLEQASA